MSDASPEAPPGTPRRQRSSSAGGNYSRFVGLMRVALPTIALIVVVSLVIWPKLQGQDDRFRLGFSALSAKEAEALNMVNGQFFGA
ncbi:MAG: hypothetical protein RLN80_02170, partial [Rhodospirillales bacterium]